MFQNIYCLEQSYVQDGELYIINKQTLYEVVGNNVILYIMGLVILKQLKRIN